MKLLDSITFYQSSCYYCPAAFSVVKPAIERGGIRCNKCGKLHERLWTEKEFREMQAAYGSVRH